LLLLSPSSLFPPFFFLFWLFLFVFLWFFFSASSSFLLARSLSFFFFCLALFSALVGEVRAATFLFAEATAGVAPAGAAGADAAGWAPVCTVTVVCAMAYVLGLVPEIKKSPLCLTQAAAAVVTGSGAGQLLVTVRVSGLTPAKAQ